MADVSGAIRVIDGDTLDVGGVRVRLHGIDAPELGQTCTSARGQTWDCGTWASRAVRARYQGIRAACDPVDTDRFGRVVATCRVAGRDLGRDLVRAGLAVAFRKYSDAYVADERIAERQRAGLHAGTFQNPAEYRHGKPAQVAAAQPACAIKGNISKKGQRIFHVPGQRFYEATRIQGTRGERWFCTEAEARAAGWRKARR